MIHFHKYSLHELEDMMPWERDVYVKMTIDHLEKMKERERQTRSGVF